MRYLHTAKSVAAVVGAAAMLTATASRPAQADLLAFYTFDNGTVNFGTGTVADVSGNGNTGTLVGSPTAVSGVENEALNFDGSSQFVRLSTVNINASVLPQLTMGGWFSADNASRLQALISHDDAPFDRALEIDFRDATDGGEYEWSAFAGSVQQVVGGPDVGATPTGYVFVALRHDAATQVLNLDVDGVRLTRTGVTYTPGLTFTDIGHNPTFGEFFDGRADNVFFYNNVLSDTQIDAIRVGGASAILGAPAAAPEPSALFLTGIGLAVAASSGVRARKRRTA